MEIKKWLKIMNDFYDNKDSFECPYCKSSNIGIQSKILDKSKDDSGFIIMWCNDCKKGALAVSLKKVRREQNDEIPKDIQWR